MTVNYLFFVVEFARISVFFFIVLTLIRALYNGIQNRESLEKKYFILFGISLVLSLIYAVSGIIIVIMGLLGEYNSYRVIGVSIYTASGYIFLILFCFQIYIRLYASLSETVYALSRTKHVIIITSLVIIVLSAISTVAFVRISLQFSQLFIIPAFFIYNFVSVYMVIVFIKALLKFMKQMDGDKEMINLVTKYIVTSIIAYSSSILLLGLSLFMIRASIAPDVAYLLNALDGLFNLSALYLQYNFAENDYNRCCKICHRCVLCCVGFNLSKENITSISVEIAPIDQ